MRRRAFITLLGGAATSSAVWPLTARAEKNGGVRRVGVIMGFAEDDEVWQAYLATFRQRLQDFGWSEGRNSVRLPPRIGRLPEALARILCAFISREQRARDALACSP